MEVKSLETGRKPFPQRQLPCPLGGRSVGRLKTNHDLIHQEPQPAQRLVSRRVTLGGLGGVGDGRKCSWDHFRPPSNSCLLSLSAQFLNTYVLLGGLGQETHLSPLSLRDPHPEHLRIEVLGVVRESERTGVTTTNHTRFLISLEEKKRGGEWWWRTWRYKCRPTFLNK